MLECIVETFEITEVSVFRRRQSRVAVALNWIKLEEECAQFSWYRARHMSGFLGG